MDIIYKCEIPLIPRSKKNSMQIVKFGDKTALIQSKLYRDYADDCKFFIKQLKTPINIPVNLKCVFYVKDKRKRDLVNLLNAIQDILVKYNILKDDNYNIITSVNGSKIIYDKQISKTIIEISNYENL